MQVKHRLNVKLKILRIITGDVFAFCARRIVLFYFRAKPSHCSTCGLIFNPHIINSILYSLHYGCQRLHLTLSAISEKCEYMLKGKPKVRTKQQDINLRKISISRRLLVPQTIIRQWPPLRIFLMRRSPNRSLVVRPLSGVHFSQ